MLKINIQNKLKEKGLNKNQFAKLMQIGYPAACALYDRYFRKYMQGS